ncbi:NitT/TauT family transport system permease protein [Georgenia soli]|uniref:NitT/TauT family transport system permease protein n=1 Tax=Georgenia soli TaxID=638953 RepID=A0A2A9F3I3_9MICO|nr:ABC transporter permease [Georgenia soli]PFG45112.1 NitT/TauT family transport system permease protein [Georgenia soli]
MTTITHKHRTETLESQAKRKPVNKATPYLVGIGIIILWQLTVVILRVPEYVVPTPTRVAAAFVENADILWRNLQPTVIESLAGFVIGNVVAFVFAVIFVHSKTINGALMPIAVFVQTIPIIAIAPILVILLGTGYSSKIVIAALISFFPTLVNSVRGLNAVNDRELELMRILSATRWEIFTRVRLYACVPYLFSALRITATSAVIGAIVAEWVGSQAGLGYLIIQTTFNYQVPLLYATMILSSLYALLLFGLVGLVEKRVVYWKATQ